MVGATFSGGETDVWPPRLWKPTDENLWCCPKCEHPAVLWYMPYMRAPRWFCDDCRIGGRLDAGETPWRYT